MRARLRRLRAYLSRRRDTCSASTTDHSPRDLPPLDRMTEQRIAAEQRLHRRASRWE